MGGAHLESLIRVLMTKHTQSLIKYSLFNSYVKLNVSSKYVFVSSSLKNGLKSILLKRNFYIIEEDSMCCELSWAESWGTER